MRRMKFERSSNLHSMSTNVRQRTATVWFRNKAKYRYFDVDQEDVQLIVQAEHQRCSVGTVFNFTIRKCRYQQLVRPSLTPTAATPATPATAVSKQEGK